MESGGDAREISSQIYVGFLRQNSAAISEVSPKEFSDESQLIFQKVFLEALLQKSLVKFPKKFLKFFFGNP